MPDTRPIHGQRMYDAVLMHDNPSPMQVQRNLNKGSPRCSPRHDNARTPPPLFCYVVLVPHSAFAALRRLSKCGMMATTPTTASRPSTDIILMNAFASSPLNACLCRTGSSSKAPTSCLSCAVPNVAKRVLSMPRTTAHTQACTLTTEAAVLLTLQRHCVEQDRLEIDGIDEKERSTCACSLG